MFITRKVFVKTLCTRLPTVKSLSVLELEKVADDLLFKTPVVWKPLGICLHKADLGNGVSAILDVGGYEEQENNVTTVIVTQGKNTVKYTIGHSFTFLENWTFVNNGESLPQGFNGIQKK